MPIIHADLAENVIFLKRSMRPGFAGIENELLYNPKTLLVFGDAKDTSPSSSRRQGLVGAL
jgi:NAD(P) transhydrogenase subunit beta